MKICSVALAYPRFELDFIAEWLDYHLTLGVDRIFLGLHVNEENVTREHLIPAKRPYPQMYHLDGSEGDILSEFYHRIHPFRERLETFIFRRNENRMHAHCEEQKELYQLVLDQYRNDFDWIAVHDIDEFMVPVRTPDLKSAMRAYGADVAAVRMQQVICEPRWNEFFEPITEPILSRHRRMMGVVPGFHGCKTISKLAQTRKIAIHASDVSGAVAQDDAIRIYHYRGFPSKTEIRTGYVLPVEREEFDEIDNRPQTLLAQAKACNLNLPSIPGIMPQFTKKPERKPLIRVFTFSYRRLNYICATINALKAQTLTGFIHHLHLLGYTKEQAEFVRQVANGDDRFVISELENLSQRENLMRILEEMPLDAESYIRMDDDDVYLPTYLQEMYKASLENGSDLTAFTTLLRHNQRTGDSHLVRQSGIYGMTMCLSRKAVGHLLSRPNWGHPGFEDSWMDRSMELAGYKRHITQTAKPLVLYVQHATNVSCADPVAASPVTVAPPVADIAIQQPAPRVIPSRPPDSTIPFLDPGSEGEIGLYETGEFILPATGEAGNWEVADDGGLILEFWDSGKKASYACNEGARPDPLLTDRADEPLTVIILSWKRVDNIHSIIRAYADYASVSEILVWNNNPDVTFKSEGKVNAINCTRDMGLDTRFHAALLATSQVVLMQDDDILLPEETVIGLLGAWGKDPDIIHGLRGRDPRPDGNYAIFLDNQDAEIDVILTNTAIFSRNKVPAFFAARQRPEIQEVRRQCALLGTHSDNGEDILFSYVVKHSTGRKNRIHALHHLSLPQGDASISSCKGHWDARNLMLNAARKLLDTGKKALTLDPE